MAYIKIFPIKATVTKAINYISNPDKTEDQLLASSYACTLESADVEFEMTRQMGKQNVMDKGSNLAFHLIQSFKPGEITDPTLAHELGKQFANEVLRGKHEYVITTHVDKGHIHNHIIFNATNFIDYHKYVSNKKSYHKICQISNRICRENGLTESMPTGEKGRSYKEDMEYKKGTSWKAKLRNATDKAIWSSTSFDEFLSKMKLSGYEVRMGKNISFRAPEQKHFTYLKSIGTYYNEENILLRLEKNRHKAKTPRLAFREVRLFVQIAGYVTTGNRVGFERWAQLNNLKEAAKTFNYLSENNLLNYKDYRNKITDITDSIKATDTAIKNLDQEISNQRIIQKHCAAYRRCKEVVAKEKAATHPDRYRTQHNGEYRLHKASKKALKELGIQKLPSPQRLTSQIQKMESKRISLTEEYQKLKKEKQVMDVVNSNIEAYFRDAPALDNQRIH